MERLNQHLSKLLVSDPSVYIIATVGGKIDAFGNIVVSKGQPRKAVNAHIDSVTPMESMSYGRWTSPNAAHFNLFQKYFPKPKPVVDSLPYPNADDRVGIAICLTLLEGSRDLLAVFTQGEEMGSVGATSIDPEVFKGIAYSITFDRQGVKDIVGEISGIPLASPKFVERAMSIASGRKLANGLPADPEVFARRRLVPNSLNVSCGYYFPHTRESAIVLREVQDTFLLGKRLLAELPLWTPAWWEAYQLCAVCEEVIREGEKTLRLVDEAEEMIVHRDCVFKPKNTPFEINGWGSYDSLYPGYDFDAP